jgi:hypothetical protein
VTATSIATRLAGNGLQQHMYAKPTAVAEACRKLGYSCWTDGECCGYFEGGWAVCEFWTCRRI